MTFLTRDRIIIEEFKFYCVMDLDFLGYDRNNYRIGNPFKRIIREYNYEYKFKIYIIANVAEYVCKTIK